MIRVCLTFLVESFLSDICCFRRMTIALTLGCKLTSYGPHHMHRIDAAYCYRCRIFHSLCVSGKPVSPAKRMDRSKCHLEDRLVFTQRTTIGAIWRIRLNDPYASTVRLYVILILQLVTILPNACFAARFCGSSVRPFACLSICRTRED